MGLENLISFKEKINFYSENIISNDTKKNESNILTYKSLVKPQNIHSED